MKFKVSNNQEHATFWFHLRVRLAMASMTLMSVSMAILGAVLYLKDKGADGTVLR